MGDLPVSKLEQDYIGAASKSLAGNSRQPVVISLAASTGK